LYGPAKARHSLHFTPEERMKLSPSIYMAGRCSPEEAREQAKYCSPPPRFGRFWWFWLPTPQWNGGLPWRDVCTDVTLKFLCFGVNLLIWRTGNRKELRQESVRNALPAMDLETSATESRPIY
jgi:hypothetical protein